MKAYSSNELKAIYTRIAGVGLGTGLLVPVNSVTRTRVSGPTFEVSLRYSDVMEGAGAGGQRYWDLLQQVPTTNAVGVLAFINNLLAMRGRDAEVHRILNEKFLSPTLRKAVTNFRPGGPAFAVVFTRIGCLQLIRHLMLYGRSSTGNAEAPIETVGELVLFSNEYLRSDWFPPTPQPDALEVALQFVPNWDIDNPRDLAYTLARMHTILTEILPGTDPQVRNLSAQIGIDASALTVDGLALSDFIAVVFGIYSFAGEVEKKGALSAVFDYTQVFEKVGFPQPILEAFIASRSLTLSGFKARLRADIIRMREGRAERARDHRTPKAQGSSMSWTSWHVDAIVSLGRVESEAILLDLLNEPEYEVDAAWGLQVIARKTQPGPNAIMPARFGQPLRDYRRLRSGVPEWLTVFAEDRRIKYADAIQRRILNLLEQSKTGDHNVNAYHYRVKELAKVLGTVDPQNSARLIMDIAELPSRFDGWSRLALLEALVFARIALPMGRVAAILEPVLAELRAHGIHNNASLLTHLLSILPFVDEPKRGIARIRELLSEFRIYWYDTRNLLFALAQCEDDSGLTLLGDIAGLSDSVFDHIAKEWIDAVASCPLPGSRAMIMSFVDPDTTPRIGSRALPGYAVDILASHLADLGRSDSYVAERLIALTTRPVSALQRAILEKVLARIGSPESLLAGLNLIDDSSPQPIPYDIFRVIEDFFLEKRPYGADAQSYTLVPRAANNLKTRLFEMAKHDPRRAKSAYGLLAQIEVWRLEYGRPLSEPRHPVFESGELWPPIEPSHSDSVGSKPLGNNAQLGLEKVS